MSELETQVRAAGRTVAPQWSEERAAGARSGIARKQRRRRQARAAMVAVSLAVVAGFFLRKPVRVPPPDGRVLLSDGSTIEPSVPGSVRMLIERPEEVRVALDRGRAVFSVQHRPERVFRVQAGSIAVQVLGTRFAVLRDGERTSVQVFDGRVRVFSNNSYVDLSAGEEGQWPRSTVAAAPVLATTEPTAESVAVPVVPVRTVSAAQVLRSAEQAERAGRREEALRGYRSFLSMSSVGDEAAYAANRMGRLLDAQAPEEAARAYARAVRSAPQGPLAEDSLAHQAQAYARARNEALFVQTRALYLQRYPAGSFATALQSTSVAP